MNTRRVFIAAAKRTAIGAFNGTLSETPSSALAASIIKDIVVSTGVPCEAINEVIVGNCFSTISGQGVARQAAINAGLPVTVPAYSVNMVCGSGMKAVQIALQTLNLTGGLAIAGGVENMSLAPYALQGARKGFKMGDRNLIDSMVYDGLTDAFSKQHMGVTAENIAERFEITREHQDTFAFQSQQKAIAAVDNGLFAGEITPLTVKSGKNEILFNVDEYPNRTTSLEKLAKLRPAFKPNGVVTAGNSSGINDGAALLLVADEDGLKRHSLLPLCEIVGIGQGGVDPAVMGLGVVPAVKNALRSANLNLSDMNCLELNEAFAAQLIGVIGELSKEHDMSIEEIMSRTNLNGGAIALGHPIGASGARIIVTLVHIMKTKHLKYGLASLCIGGGMGTAIILKNAN